jgi:hypothetical protein
MHYTQGGGFMEDSPRHSNPEPSWMSVLAGNAVWLVSGIAIVLVIAGGIVVLQAVVATIGKIFP